MSYFFQGFPTMQYDVFANGRPVETTDLFRSVRLKNNLRDDILLYERYRIQDGERPDHVSLKLYGTTDYYWTFFMINPDIVNSFADWPCSRIEMENKIRIKYQGNVLLTEEDISNKFIRGETLKGAISLATASIIQKDTDRGVIRLSTTDQVGTFVDGELIRGLTSNDQIAIDRQIPYSVNPNHFEDSTRFWVRKDYPGAVGIPNDQHEREWNEFKTDIKVIRPEYITQVVDEFYKIINPDQQ